MPADEEHQREMAKRFGENARRLREARGLSQRDLAEQMTDRNWQYHQSTVYKVEHGERKVSFGEAADLAAILKTSLDRFTWTGAETNESAMVDRSIGILRRSWREAADATARLIGARAGAEHALTTLQDSKYARTRAACSELAAELERATVDMAVSEGAAMHENLE